jgi:2-C-methyl-D-erythritol 4-phosphate cytidylyltransferase
MDCTIVLVAAGTGRRMGFDKVWAEVDGKPLLAHAVAAARAAGPRALVLVVAPDRASDARQLASEAQVVVGGERRRDSVAAGLHVARGEWVAVHDAARAFAPAALYARGLAAAQPSGAAVPGLPLVDTIKRVVDGRVVETPARAAHVAVQTPQIFRRTVLAAALAQFADDVTDEAALVERLGIAVAVFDGDPRAFKVTTPLDFALARALDHPVLP